MKHGSNLRILIFGHPGEGKTTLAVKFMKEALRRGEFVYSNISIKWFGDLYKLPIYKRVLNKIIKAVLFFIVPFIRKKIYYIEKNIAKLNDLEDSNDMVNDFPTVDLQLIYVKKYLALESKKKMNQIIDVYNNGYFSSHWFDPSRYQFLEDLSEATIEAVRHGTEHLNAKHLFCWDEGFIDLDFSHGVPAHITNFFNQSRKLNVDVIVCTQRPVAVYPAFRALCNYMLQVKKIPVFNIFFARQYFVDDDPNALPDITGGFDGQHRAKVKYIWRGKYIFPYFVSRQSIALIRLITSSKK